MPKGMLSKHGNWIHLHQHPCISRREFSASHICGAFFIARQPHRNPAGRAGGFDKE